ncbi:MAG TPA: amino acid adenylation domain-containing protein [Blastocatellia bacterium]|jgi:amino acid adenylation domain-containing protein|nr:amino acid adenylation domain-containing protein [Blastocatellia bacterium]
MQGDIIEGVRLSPQQRHVWQLQQAPDAKSYSAQCAVLIEGDLHDAALKNAVEKVIDRHEILRTSFHRLPEMTEPLQIIGGGNFSFFHDHSLLGLDRDRQYAHLDAIFARQGRALFDFEKGPLLQITLFDLAASAHMLLVATPSLCADKVGLVNLIEEISDSYAAMIGGEEVAKEPIQYADYSEWNNELLESEDAQEGRKYWGEPTDDYYGDLKLPFEKHDPCGGRRESQAITTDLPSEYAGKLEAIANEYECSVRAALQSCWQALVWRLTAEPRVTIFTAFDGRRHEELEGAIGLFARHLPIRARLGANLRFSEILKRSEAALQEASLWQEYFEAEPPSEASRIPIGFEYDVWPHNHQAGGLSFSFYKLNCPLDNFKIKFSCVHKAGSLSLEIHYDPGSFLKEDMSRLTGQYLALLQGAVERPESVVSEFDILSNDERRLLLLDINKTDADYPLDNCVHEFIEQQASRTPDKTAVIFKGERLTYAELDARSNQLARHLIKMGVGPEVPVAIFVERSLEMVIGILGVLKAGGFYLPLDWTNPPERLAFMLEDAGAAVLLTSSKLAGKLPDHKAKVIDLNAGWEAISNESSAKPTIDQTPDNLAYAIYTSGSTGKPKGVMITHRGLSNYLNWCVRSYGVSDECSSPVHSPIGFDFTVSSLFSPLLVGGSVALLSEDQDVESLGRALNSGNGFSLVKITPSHLEILNSTLHEAGAEKKTLLIGGEPLHYEDLSGWRDRLPDTRIINEYGPTEATVGCCVYDFPARDSRSGAVPIGQPVANTRIYLLDRYLKPVPTGAPGELHISGEGLARGYINRPELTAEKFVPDPFGGKPGGRLYKTGDLARYLPDGNIEFLGRLDHQVKIRGYRIELGEIENQIMRMASVRKAIVMTDGAQNTNARLVAYVVPGRDFSFSPENQLRDSTVARGDDAAGHGTGAAWRTPEGLRMAIRSGLKESLPDYMVPSEFVFVEDFPVTANGKVDRDALGKVEGIRPDRNKTRVAPRTDTERAIASIWQDVLQINEIGTQDNFFDVGGHSITLVKVGSLLGEHFGEDIPITTLLAHPTIQALAAHLGRERESEIERDSSAVFTTIDKGKENLLRSLRRQRSFGDR